MPDSAQHEQGRSPVGLGVQQQHPGRRGHHLRAAVPAQLLREGGGAHPGSGTESGCVMCCQMSSKSSCNLGAFPSNPFRGPASGGAAQGGTARAHLYKQLAHGGRPLGAPCRVLRRRQRRRQRKARPRRGVQPLHGRALQGRGRRVGFRRLQRAQGWDLRLQRARREGCICAVRCRARGGLLPHRSTPR